MPSDCNPQSTQLSRRELLKGITALGLSGWPLLYGSNANASALRVNAPAPVATLVTLDGQRISTTELLGNVVILTFWATWCSPCREELPLLSDYAVEHAAQGLTILGFSLNAPSELKQVRKYAQTLHFPVGLLANSSAGGYGRIWRLPVSFTIDRIGNLIDNGWRDKQPAWTRERLDRIVTPLLHAPV